MNQDAIAVLFVLHRFSNQPAKKWTKRFSAKIAGEFIDYWKNSNKLIKSVDISN